jgi:hypothetical protein
MPVTLSEAQILRTCLIRLAYLEVQGKLIFWRQNNGATYDIKRGAYRKGGIGQRNGVPDIMVILPNGRALGIECKTASGKQSVGQVSIERDMKRMGAAYAVVRSTDDLNAVLTECGIT